jgi:hypothetical protein
LPPVDLLVFKRDSYWVCEDFAICHSADELKERGRGVENFEDVGAVAEVLVLIESEVMHELAALEETPLFEVLDAVIWEFDPVPDRLLPVFGRCGAPGVL